MGGGDDDAIAEELIVRQAFGRTVDFMLCARVFEASENALVGLPLSHDLNKVAHRICGVARTSTEVAYGLQESIQNKN